MVIIPSSKAYEPIKETEQEMLADKIDEDADEGADEGNFATSLIEPKMEVI